MGLRGKKILITAGPTWIPIDKVRVISNIASGETGILLAKAADRLGLEVTLILGPIGEVDLKKTIGIKRFRYFNDLHNIIKKELKDKRYDIVVHSAAVSDYQPKRAFSEKIKSNINNLKLELEKTVKIVDKIKKYAPSVFLTLFKLELSIPKEEMFKRARVVMKSAKADLAVVNTFSSKVPYTAFILDRDQVFCKLNSKQGLAKNIFPIISAKFN